jgi:hypothetical protein
VWLYRRYVFTLEERSKRLKWERVRAGIRENESPSRCGRGSQLEFDCDERHEWGEGRGRATMTWVRLSYGRNGWTDDALDEWMDDGRSP